jgi:hypothetical protein
MHAAASCGASGPRGTSSGAVSESTVGAEVDVDVDVGLRLSLGVGVAAEAKSWAR